MSCMATKRKQLDSDQSVPLSTTLQIRMSQDIRDAIDAFRDDFKAKHGIKPSLNEVSLMAIEKLLTERGFLPLKPDAKA